jgi:hypothetical protein
MEAIDFLKTNRFIINFSGEGLRNVPNYLFESYFVMVNEKEITLIIEMLQTQHYIFNISDLKLVNQVNIQYLDNLANITEEHQFEINERELIKKGKYSSYEPQRLRFIFKCELDKVKVIYTDERTS